MHGSNVSNAVVSGGLGGDHDCPPFGQPHYTVDQVAEMWSISRDTIRRLFAAEPGVLQIVRPGNCYKRTYSTLPIRRACSTAFTGGSLCGEQSLKKKLPTLCAEKMTYFEPLGIRRSNSKSDQR